MSTAENAHDQTAPAAVALPRDRARELLGQVMGLVAVTVGFTALGAYLGRDLSGGVGLVLFIAAFACIIGLNVAAATRPRATGDRPAVRARAAARPRGRAADRDYANADPAALWQAAGATRLFVAGAGSYGYATRRDLSSWARTLFWALLALIAFGIVAIFVSIPRATSSTPSRGSGSSAATRSSTSTACAAAPRTTPCRSRRASSSTSSTSSCSFSTVRRRARLRSDHRDEDDADPQPAGRARRRDPMGQLRAADRRRPPREGRRRRLLDLLVHQLAPHAALRPGVGRAYRDRGLVVVGVHDARSSASSTTSGTCGARSPPGRRATRSSSTTTFAIWQRVREPLLAGALRRRRRGAASATTTSARAPTRSPRRSIRGLLGVDGDRVQRSDAGRRRCGRLGQPALPGDLRRLPPAASAAPATAPAGWALNEWALVRPVGGRRRVRRARGRRADRSRTASRPATSTSS